MTIKELKANILLALYKRYKDNKRDAIQLTELCKEDGLIYDSITQLSSAANHLKDSGYINAIFFEGGDALIRSLTANGIEFVEENLLTQEDILIDGLNDTSKYMMQESIGIDDDTAIDTDVSNPSNHESINATKIFSPKKNIKIIKDLDVEPCFSVDELAECFIEQIDKIAESKSENIPMIGVFAPWGRGKSYFLNRVISKLGTQSSKVASIFKICNKQITTKYKIIKFNAWKYQDTPAIWAYLFETIYKYASPWQKVKIFFKHNLKFTNLLVFVLLIGLSFFIGTLFDVFPEIVDGVNNVVTIGGIGSILSIMLTWTYTLKDNPVSAMNIIRKYTKRKSYTDCLGIQNAIEADLETVLSTLASKNNKVLLCVDDIDRCVPEKMTCIIDSLRTILENDEIRKNLIVICSIDINKLMKGYVKVYSIETPDYITDNIREHIDKIFIFSIGLASLGAYQLKEYLYKMMSLHESGESETIDETFVDINRQKEAIYIADTKDEQHTLSDKEIYNIIGDFLSKSDSINITPRKLRIMYYQLLFANNVSSKHGIVLPEKLIYDLLKKSLTGIENHSKDTALSDIIEISVPY